MGTLLVLTSYAALASVACVVRARLASRAEALLAVFMVWNFLVLAPIHLLGVINALTAHKLAVASFALSSVAFGASFLGTSARQHVPDIVRSAEGMARLPFDALTLCVRARSLVLVGVVGAAAVIAWTAWLSYLAPSDSWDGLIYHETMVGYAIQNHGYRPAALPLIESPVMLFEATNGFPRNCEMTSLWFVIFWDRRLIEVVNSVMAVPLGLATYVLATRYARNQLAAVGWACAMVLTPGGALELRSTYIDVQVAALLLAALHFCTRPRMRVRDGWMASLCLALLIGAKSQALLWVPFLGVIALVRLGWQAGRSRAISVVCTCLGGLLLIAAMGSVTYLRNWYNFHNPLWPMSYDREWPKIHWPGPSSVALMGQDVPLEKILETMLQSPSFGHEYTDRGIWGWGFVFLLLPMSALAATRLVVDLARAALRRLVGGVQLADDSCAALNLLLVWTVLFLTAYGAWSTRTLFHPRYNLHLVAGVMVLVHWAWARAGRVAEGAAILCVVGNLLWLFWAKPAWGLDVADAKRYWKMPAAERATLPSADWSIAPDAAAAREQLAPGSLVVFTDEISFPPLLWNERYTNRIQHMPDRFPHVSPADFIALAEEQNAQWIVAAVSSELDSALAAVPTRWVPVGLASRGGGPNRAFRRVSSAAAATP